VFMGWVASNPDLPKPAVEDESQAAD